MRSAGGRKEKDREREKDKERGKRVKEFVVEARSGGRKGKEHDMRQFMGLWGGNAQVTEAIMDSFGVETAALKVLASSNHWQHLRKLSLNDNLINGDGLRMLAKCNWPDLEELTLESNRIDADSVQILGRTVWKRLLLLSLARNGLNQGLAAFQLMDYAQLAVLVLAATRLQAKSIQTMPDWRCLATVDLSYNRLGEQGAAALARLEWPMLIKLDLNCTKLGGRGVRRLAGGLWRKLRTLTLRDNELDDECMRELAKSNWEKLQTLTLYGNPMTMRVFDFLAGSQWPQLQTLEMEFMGVDDTGFVRMVKCDWPCLHQLSFFYSVQANRRRLSSWAVNVVKIRKPHLQIQQNLKKRR